MGACALLATGAGAASSPDVLLIVADDLGFSDLGCFGGEIPTPHLDELAANGLRLAQSYSFARCSPSRAALLTGRYPHEVGMGMLAEDPLTSAPADAAPAYRRYLAPEAPTLSERLREEGVHTALAGKWHLGAHAPERRPLARGFDWFYGLLYGSSSYHRPMPPRPFLRQDVEQPPPPDESGFYATDAIADELIGYLRERSPAERWFALLAFTAPHWPLHAPKEDVARFVGQYRRGWDRLREERFARQRELGVIPAHTQLPPRPEGVRAWDSLSPREQEELDYRMAVYAAQVYRLDLAVGRVVATLRELGRLENTLIIFVSDNGASAEPNTDVGGGIFEVVNQPEAFGLGSARAPAGGSSYGMGWAHLSNTPFRGYKSRLYEGGVRSPTIVHWPAGLRVPVGSISHEPMSLLDLASTILETASATYSKAHDAGGLRKVWDGRSQLAQWRGARSSRPITLAWEQYGHQAVRQGNWKIVRTDDLDASWELYDLEADPTEMSDRAATEPERLASLVALWSEWAEAVGVQPLADVRR